MSKLFLCLILVLPLVVGLQITEVELNPLGKDAGNEWIEFYSEEEINLSQYKIKNNDQDELVINHSFNKYFIYYFQNQWLDNVDESVFIYNNSKLIFQTPLFEDKENNEKTWQLCNNEWLFQKQTKNKENCDEIPKQKNKTSFKNSTNEEILSNEEKKENFFTRRDEKTKNLSQISKNITKETIQLNPKTIKKEKTTSSLGEKNYAKYSIIGFCILLFSLYLIKSKKKKNEWQ
ncbi:MAG TPA: hypothetical protein VJ895_02765 [Candidatus Nanoarchaeia archaeon]|nr:hypothetical protein [Candidatus Nanoarchaeia archaeon]